jgi:hypothetical protein
MTLQINPEMSDPRISVAALALLANLLEDAENTQVICDDLKPWSELKPQIEELWKLYEHQLDLARQSA